MQLQFTPRAVRKLKEILAAKGGGLAIRIRIRRTLSGFEWSITLEPATPEAIYVDGLPILADQATQSRLDGLVIDWVQTPSGPGLGVYDRNLVQRDLRQGAD
jgi:Fe-S cluster assembly iron-binding protein IscA